MATRILRVSHFLRAIARRGASAGTPALTLHAGNTPGSSRPLARITTRRKQGGTIYDHGMMSKQVAATLGSGPAGTAGLGRAACDHGQPSR